MRSILLLLDMHYVNFNYIVEAVTTQQRQHIQIRMSDAWKREAKCNTWYLCIASESDRKSQFPISHQILCIL